MHSPLTVLKRNLFVLAETLLNFVLKLLSIKITILTCAIDYTPLRDCNFYPRIDAMLHNDGIKHLKQVQSLSIYTFTTIKYIKRDEKDHREKVYIFIWQFAMIGNYLNHYFVRNSEPLANVGS